MTQALARVRQVWHYLTKRASRADETWALMHLPEAAHALYLGMKPYDRAHCTAIARCFSCLNPPEWALQAALLHDCGKPANFGLLSRIGAVLAKKRPPPCEPPERQAWKRAQQVYHWHGHYGADLASRAGLAEEACLLIRHHHDPDAEKALWLEEFQRIDDD